MTQQWEPGADRTPAIARFTSPSLFLRVFLVNAALLVTAAVVLALSPVTISFPVTTHQLVVLGIGLVLILTANAVLLRVSFRPLRELTRLMRRIDLLTPGARLSVAGARELAVVTETFNEMLDRLELERRESSTRSLSGQEEERRRLAAELHDEIGQGLTAVLLRLKNLSTDAPPGLQERLADAQDLIRARLDEVRRLVRQLRPSVLDDLGLGYALLSLADVFEQSGAFTVRRQVDPLLPRLSTASELALYRIAQEALTNIARHADASYVDLRLWLTDQPPRAVLSVGDDGRGMLYAVDVEGGGMRGMRERALAVNGDLVIDSQPGRGTSVVVSLPTDTP